MAHSKTDREEALADLNKLVKPGDRIFTILRHSASSGMQRTIQMVLFRGGDPYYLRYTASVALDMPYDKKNEGVKIRGAGMDMGFALVSHLSYALFGKENALKQDWL